MNKSQQQSTKENLVNYIENMLVIHTAFQTAINQLNQLYNVAPSLIDPIGAIISGESRAGKSRLIEEFTSNYKEFRTEEGLIKPIVKVVVPSKPTVKGLATNILSAMGDALANKGTEQAKTNRLMILLKACKVRMLILDEAQHIIDKSSKYTLIHHVSDWLKNLMSESKVVIVIAGLEYSQNILNQNEQLRGRFTSKIQMPRFNWEDSQSRSEFMGIMAGFHEYLSKKISLPELGSEELALRFYFASGGLVGIVFNILRKAVWNIALENKTSIELRDLERAYEEMIDQLDQHPINPFSRKFDLQDGQSYEKSRTVGLRYDFHSKQINRPYLN